MEFILVFQVVTPAPGEPSVVRATSGAQGQGWHFDFPGSTLDDSKASARAFLEALQTDGETGATNWIRNNVPDPGNGDANWAEDIYDRLFIGNTQVEANGMPFFDLADTVDDLSSSGSAEMSIEDGEPGGDLDDTPEDLDGAVSDDTLADTLFDALLDAVAAL